MSAQSTDLFKKLSRRWVGQIGSGGVADGTTTTVPLSSATNLPTGTAVVVVVDRVDANGNATAGSEETVIGVVSGSNLVSCVRGAEGTAQAHNAGAVVEVLFTAKGWNDLIDGLLVDHTQLGHHSSLTDANGNDWIKQSATASAVNEITVTNAATGNAPLVSATGDDTNIDLNLKGKGTGKVKVSGAYTLPSADGSSNQVLKTNGSGALSFADPATSSGTLQSIQQTTSLVTSSTSSTTDTNALTLTFTPTASAKALIMGSISWYNGGTNQNLGDIYIDNTLATSNTWLQYDVTVANKALVMSNFFYKSSLDTTSHTIDLRVRAGAGTLNINSASLTVLVYNT